jgi:tol-pal system protein YbgF
VVAKSAARQAALLGALLAALAAAPAAAGMFDDDEARARIEALRRDTQANFRLIDERLARMEGNRAVLGLASELDALKGEIAKLRGQVEVLVNLSEQNERRQKDLYLDIDTRLRKLEKPVEGTASTDRPPGEVAVPAAETKSYEAALNQFKLGNYPMAISTFQGFLVTYPASKLAPSAQYWIGNAYYAQRDFKNAIVAQQRVVTQWPDDPKAPDALLNIASSQEAAGDRRGAQKTLETLLARYPSSQAAASAKQRMVAVPAKR